MYTFTVIGEYLLMAWQALSTHKLRSILTTLGILIGVTTIITIFTTIQGLNEYVIGQLSNIGSSTVYVQKWPWVFTNDWWKYRNRREITYTEYKALKKYSTEADYISPAVFALKKIRYKDETYDQIPVIGTNEEYKDTDNVNPATGRFLTGLDVERNHKVCVIGDEVARNLFKGESPIGKRIKIDDDKYIVIGVNEKRGNVFGQSMDNFVIVPIGTFRRVLGGWEHEHRGLRIAMTVRDVSKIDAMKDEARGILRRVRKVNPADEDDFALNQQDQLTDLYRTLTGTLFGIVFVIGGISLLVGGIGIANIMLVSVTERTKEIGIRKAIGARRRNILSQFLIEAVAIASVGGILGIILGYLGGRAVLAQMDLSTGVSLASIGIGYGFSSLVGVVAGFYPAWKGARMNPIDSLHYE
jgi:putative ABC transport system permease protein